MSYKSLDPRITRLNIAVDGELDPKQEMDQFETYEVFQQVKEGKPFEHVGIVHAPNEEMALLFGKEQYTRRGNSCTGIWIIKTEMVKTTVFTDGDNNVYDLIETVNNQGEKSDFEVFHLKKRGKQHIHAGTVKASSYEEALSVAKATLNNGLVLNVWVVKNEDILSTDTDMKDIWNTLPDKKYREAVAWKAGDKIKTFKMCNP